MGYGVTFLISLQVGRHRLRPSVPDRIGGDHAIAGDDEHRLAFLVTENIDVVRALDLRGLKGWRGQRRRRLDEPSQHSDDERAAQDGVQVS
jgi:hypothetical protein